MIHGPASADGFRVKVGRYGDRWYTDPLPLCSIADESDWQGPSVSATKPPFANKYVLMRAVAEMASSEWARLAGVDADTRYEAIKSNDKLVSEINMRRGSIVHAWAEDLLAGRPMMTPIAESGAAVQQALKFQDALRSFFDAWQPEPVAVEVVCLNRSLNGVGYGGTADVFARVDGAVWAIDWKSRMSDHGAYLEEAAQGGAYCGAEYMIVDAGDGTAARAPIPEVAGVLIVSITADGYRAFPIDRDGAVRAYTEMHRWWCAQQDFTRTKVIGRPWAPKIAAPSAMSSEVERPAPGAMSPETPGATPDELRSRIGQLIDAGHKELLVKRWPRRADGTGVPTFKIGGHVDSDWPLLEAMVVAVEAEVGAPFDPPPPAAQPKPKRKKRTEPASVIDEGGNLTPIDLETLSRAYGALGGAGLAAIKRIANEANAAGRSISVQLHPTVRRWSIARALIRWAQNSRDTDELFAAVAAIANDVSDPDATLGALIGAFTIEQANALHDALDRPVAA